MNERLRSVLERPLTGTLVAFVLALVAFVPALQNGFVKFDDPSYVLEHPIVLSGFNWSSVRWAFTAFHWTNNPNPNFPLTWLSHCLDVTLFGLNPMGHHATSILVHALSSALLVAAIRALTQRPVVALVVGVLFAIHPQHVESVAWISERKDVLSALGFIAMLWAYAAAHRRNQPWLLALAVVLFVLGLLAKSMLVTVPPLLLVIDLLVLRRPLSRRVFLEKVPFAIVAAFFAALTVHMQTTARGQWSWSYVGDAFVATARYVAQTIWPADLSPFYVAPWDGWPWPVVATSAVAVVAITAAVVAAFVRKRAYAPLAGWLWFCGMLVPVIGLVKVGLQSMADRYTYLPHIGLFLVAGVGVDALVRDPRRVRAVAAACAIVVMALVMRTHQQIRIWHDGRSMWLAAIDADADNYWAHFYLAHLALSEGDMDTALRSARIAASLAPGATAILERLGAVEMLVGNYAAAEPPLRVVVRGDPSRDVAAFLLAEVCRQTGRSDEAQALFARAVELARKNGHADIATRAQQALDGGAVTDLSDPMRPVPVLPEH